MQSSSSARRLVVVGVDGSEQSVAALRWALTEGSRPGDTIRAITVIGSDDLLPGTSFAVQPYGRHPVPPLGFSLTELVTELRREGLGDRYLEADTGRGDPATALLTAAAEADLLAVGTHRGGAVKELLMGSVATECVRRASCPVTVINPVAAKRLAPAATD
ncbi:universal stress protein [Amycolatopsis sp. CA-230715]|uniref:universal stress protein n=1 Tax=Amycolatopsis sp. CA-230715 TaxID=2745196 RepID=UPI001C018D1E|nr:universal stress protein [Amycolatopsis sp. CA-230715]QWF84472.1 hypothetical protein HUW46_07922 [Amycolatopsis sp. CA-230715]